MPMSSLNAELTAPNCAAPVVGLARLWSTMARTRFCGAGDWGSASMLLMSCRPANVHVGLSPSLKFAQTESAIDFVARKLVE